MTVRLERNKTMKAKKDPMAALKEELAGMKTSALNKRAREVGVGVDAMDNAADEDDPRAALIALIVAASPVDSLPLVPADLVDPKRGNLPLVPSDLEP